MSTKTLTAVLTTALATASVTAIALTGGGSTASASAPTMDIVNAAADSAVQTEPAVDPSAPSPRHRARVRGLVGRALHGELVVGGKDGKTVDVAVQRGQVTAVSPTSITLRSTDGFSRTYVLTTDSKIHVGKTTSTVADVKTGAQGAVVATKDGAAYDVRRLTLRLS